MRFRRLDLQPASVQKSKSMNRRIWPLFAGVLLLIPGCVGWDAMGVRPRGDFPKGNLSNEQRQALRSAAASGEPDLIATAARMAWDKPDDAVWLANYAASLIPDRSQEIAAAVTTAVRR